MVYGLCCCLDTRMYGVGSRASHASRGPRERLAIHSPGPGSSPKFPFSDAGSLELDRMTLPAFSLISCYVVNPCTRHQPHHLPSALRLCTAITSEPDTSIILREASRYTDFHPVLVRHLPCLSICSATHYLRLLRCTDQHCRVELSFRRRNPSTSSLSLLLPASSSSGSGFEPLHTSTLSS